jgi:hypothetical protein
LKAGSVQSTLTPSIATVFMFMSWSIQFQHHSVLLYALCGLLTECYVSVYPSCKVNNACRCAGCFSNLRSLCL